jgi:hypothetical protein
MPSSESTLSVYSAETEGFYATDQVCATTDNLSCISNFDVFIITSQSGLPSPVSGIVGLTPDTSVNYVPNLIQQLKENN